MQATFVYKYNRISNRNVAKWLNSNTNEENKLHVLLLRIIINNITYTLVWSVALKIINITQLPAYKRSAAWKSKKLAWLSATAVENTTMSHKIALQQSWTHCIAMQPLYMCQCNLCKCQQRCYGSWLLPLLPSVKQKQRTALIMQILLHQPDVYQIEISRKRRQASSTLTYSLITSLSTNEIRRILRNLAQYRVQLEDHSQCTHSWGHSGSKHLYEHTVF